MLLNNVKSIFLSIILVFFISACSNLDIQLLNQKAVQLMNEGDIDGAIARLVSINDLNPGFPETYFNLGVAYEQKEEFEKAIEAFNKSTQLKKDFADAYFSLGVVYEKLAYKILEKKQPILNVKKKIKLNNEEKEKVTDFLNKSIESFEQYIAVNPKANDKDEVCNKVTQLNEDIKEYCQYELKK